jgi:hypothetical protein
MINDIVERLREESEHDPDSHESILFRDAADEIERLRNQLADWARRSESCESRLDQLEANERVIELEQLLAEVNDATLEQAWAERNAAVAELHNHKETSGAEKGRNFSEEIKQAKKEVLLESADKCDEDYRYKVLSKHLRRMAEELTK